MRKQNANQKSGALVRGAIENDGDARQILQHYTLPSGLGSFVKQSQLKNAFHLFITTGDA